MTGSAGALARTADAQIFGQKKGVVLCANAGEGARAPSKAASPGFKIESH